MKRDKISDFLDDFRMEPTGFQPVFFKPNTEFVKWIITYAKDRLIIDAGCGEKFLLSQQLIAAGATKVVAVDPALDYNEVMKIRALNKVPLAVSFHPMIGTTERYKEMFSMGNKGILIIFARPCHSDWVEQTLDFKSDKAEALYITIPENLEKYSDLGKWDKKKKLLKHKGSSADKEVVYSIK